MKIIRLTTLLDFGGQERQFLCFSEDKTILHHHYIFASIGYGGHAEKIIRERGFEVYVFNMNPSIKNFKNIVRLYRFFKYIKPDIVHTAAAEANFHGIIAARLAGVKIIFGEEIGIPDHSNIAKISFKFIYRFTKKVICVSNAVKKYLISIGEINDQQGIVLYNPVSIPQQYNIKKSNYFTLIYVGRLEKVKNVDLLIAAFAKLKEWEKMKLVIVGDGRERAYLEQMTKDLKVDSNIEFKGFQSRPEKFVNQADLFVLPSYSEGFGIAVVEAMYQGVPCLCSKVGGIPEFIKDNETGWLFDPNNIQELTDCIKNIYKLPKNELKNIAEKGKLYATNNFSSKIYISKLENIYETFL